MVRMEQLGVREMSLTSASEASADRQVWEKENRLDGCMSASVAYLI